MRPTGRLHLGHLVGALGNWVPLQEQYDCFYFVADWHALTSDFADTSQLTSLCVRQRGRLDRRRPRSGEAARSSSSRSCPSTPSSRLLLSMVDAGALARARADLQGAAGDLKDKDLSSIGFLGYPLLQTADVTMYDARFVPVGDDQVAHLELVARSRARASTTSSATCSSSRSRC